MREYRLTIRDGDGEETVIGRFDAPPVPEVLTVLRQAEEYLKHPDVQAIPFALPASIPLMNVRKLIVELEKG